jgi:hypothetical protein
MDRTQAAARLGIKEREVRDVLDSPAGVVIVTTDGVSYIDVPEDRPDVDGKTGLMFLSAPKEGYSYAFPIFAQPEPEPEAGEDLEPAPGDEPGDNGDAEGSEGAIALASATVAEVLDWVDGDPERATGALEAERQREKPRKGVVDVLEELLADQTNDDASDESEDDETGDDEPGDDEPGDDEPGDDETAEEDAQEDDDGAE